MGRIDKGILKNLYKPPKFSHKGQNGRLTIIGGSRLFHGASLWALKTASRIVDMVFYSTVEENKELTKKLKSETYDFICVPRGKVEGYIEQSDAILIGPGFVRGTENYTGTGETGEETKKLTKRLLDKFPDKKWIIDAGSLQVMDPNWLKKLDQVIITPHHKEFYELFKPKTKDQRPKTPQHHLVRGRHIKNLNIEEQFSNLTPKYSCLQKGVPPLLAGASTSGQAMKQFNNEIIEPLSNLVSQKAKDYRITVVLKGLVDIVCSPEKCLVNTTGNEGMTKGGTGDVLAGLIAALACKNDLFLASCAGVYINGLAGDRLYKKVGPYFNASDLCDEIPKAMKELIV